MTGPLNPQSPNPPENGVVVPYHQLSATALRALIEEFITRDWSDFGDDRYTLEGKISQIMQQLKQKEAQIVFDLDQGKANIVRCR